MIFVFEEKWFRNTPPECSKQIISNIHNIYILNTISLLDISRKEINNKLVSVVNPCIEATRRRRLALPGLGAKTN